VGGKRSYQRDQLLVVVRFEEIASRARLEELFNDGILVIHSKSEDFWKFGTNLSRHLNAIDPRQRVAMTATSGRLSMAVRMASSPSTATATTSQFHWDSTILRRPVRSISWASAIKMRTTATSAHKANN
jgi:hypothetical protein